MAVITVLMPVYNAERFLRSAIDSILNQTFTDFEFLIIDDASTDDSVKIIQSYTDKRIRFYQNPVNLGITPTLNRGIELSSTELIARMDSDDISYPDRLQKQYDFLNAHSDGVLYSCWVRVIGQENQFIRQDHFDSRYYYYNLTFICWIYHPTIIFKKQAAKEVGMYTIPYAEDFELFWQLSRKQKIYNQSEVLLDYRVTDQSLHKVLKKDENEASQKRQLLRNFRYYGGEEYTIPDKFVDCLQHNFEPLLEEGSVSQVIACLHQLEFLTERILAKENINRDITAIREAAFFKRRFIILFFAEHLPIAKGILLSMRAGEIDIAKKLIRDRIKSILKPE
jgi:glycosyltransferase involved in cell wall biosynthesis